MLSLNVQGWLTRDASALSQVIKAADFDVLAFSETWAREGTDAPELDGFTSVLHLPRSRRQQRGGARGGLAVYVADKLASSVTHLSTGPQNCYAVVRFDKAVGQEEDAYMIPCYIPPEGSPSFDGKGPAVWEALREEVSATCRMGHVFVVGDLNARTSTCPDFPGSVDHPVTEEFLPSTAPPVQSQRHSRDSRERPNRWGRALLDMCVETSVRIANGRVSGDEEGQITFVSQSQVGSSLIDYVLASADAFPLIHSLTVLPAPESDHAALHLLIKRTAAAQQPLPRRQRRRHQQQHPQQPTTQQPLRLGAAQLEVWQQRLQQPDAAAQLVDIAAAADAAQVPDDMHAVGMQFDQLIETTQAEVAATAPAAKGRRRDRNAVPRWWDADLARGRRAARQAARRDPQSPAARALRQQYQHLLRRTQRQWTRSQALALTELARSINSKKFWQKFKPAKKRACPIADDVMLDSFRKLLDAPTVSSSTAGSSGSGAAPPFADGSELNSPFTAGAVQQAIGALRGGKATVGLLKLDALSAAAAQLAPCLASVFNACQRVAALPRGWALCGITPIHKGGDTSDPGNYRGIAVGSLLAKLYACMLNEKLMRWTEQHQLRARGQAGFRKDHRTTDQTFVVRTLIEKAKADKQPLYSCFVDFKKAYDTVPRDLLWEKLQRIGVHGEFLRGVQALYADVPMALQFEGGMSDTFQSTLGVKQGCPLSPTLFGIYIDDFQAELEAAGADLDLPTLCGVQAPALFYADDLDLVSTSVRGLQAQLDLLESYCKRWRLTVNVKKTKVVVYAAQAAAPPVLTYMHAPIEVLDSFTYLGVDISSRSSFAAASIGRAASAQRAALALQHRCHDLSLHDPALQLHLFDALVRPVMLYGVETWGPGALCGSGMDTCELVHRKFLRSVLGVRTGTPNVAVLGELGRFPVAHTATLAICRFWNRLVAMPDTRLTKQAFLENCALATRPGRSKPSSACWAAQVCSFLHFISPIVDGVPQHIDTSIVSAHLQRRTFDAVNGSDLRKVREWLGVRGPVNGDNYQLAGYLQAVASKTGRRRLAQFRMGSHMLGVETGRWQRLPRAERLCQRCSCGVVDDEAHMVWGCPALVDQRVQHSELFQDSDIITVADFMQQDAGQLAAFLRVCHDHCAELEGCTSNRD